MTITHKPAGEGPFPTLIFHFGSQVPRKGRSLPPQSYDPKPLAEWFVQLGWAVVFPARRSAIGSEGTYDEGSISGSRRARIANRRRRWWGRSGRSPTLMR